MKVYEVFFGALTEIIHFTVLKYVLLLSLSLFFFFFFLIQAIHLVSQPEHHLECAQAIFQCP